MAIDVEEFNRLKKFSEKKKSEYDKALGALEEQESKLKSEFNVSSITEAEQLLESLMLQESTAEKEYETELEAFQKTWGERI